MTPERWRIEEPPNERVRELAEEWMGSAALGRVLTAFGAESVGRTPRALSAWARAELDTRQGNERQVAARVSWTEEQLIALLAAGPALGMVATPSPALAHYDHTVVMGGTTTANRLRTDLAFRCRGSGIDLGAVVGLASSRPLPEWDRSRHEDVRHTTEWADLADVLTRRFGAPFPPVGNDDVIDLSTTGEGGLALQLVSAPSPSPGRRANSHDALRFLAARTPVLGDVLVVTSAIYVPYTFFTAAHALAERAPQSLEVIGTPTSVSDGREDLAQRVAQEINSALSAIARCVS